MLNLAALLFAAGAIGSTNALPSSNGIYMISSTIEDAISPSVDDSPIAKRGIDRTSCFGSGAYMNNDYLKSGIQQWCTDHDGMSVPKSKSLNAQYGGLPLSDGSPGIFSAHYTNDNVASGWVINENDCLYYMQGVVNGCQDGNKGRSQGGYVKDNTYGSVWVDPNAA